VILVEGQTDLAEVIETPSSACCLTNLLHGGQQEREEDSNHGQNNQEFKQSYSEPAKA
jgi:hypothetical protein